MKKEENQKINFVLKNDLRSRSHSPKTYLGCNTCKLKISELKKVKSNSKLSDYGTCDRNKLKKPNVEREREREREAKNPKTKLTDLCDEDKKRIVELIEELSKFAEKNQQLKESLGRMQKTKLEQQEYILKQANLHLEEKNFYINEINEFKIKVETIKSEMKKKMSQWENYERITDTEMDYLVKALKKSLKEKIELNDQINHLKICLRQSLESFQRLRSEVGQLQRQEQLIKRFKSTSCQTETKGTAHKEKCKPSDEDTEEEEFLSTCNQDTINAKSSLDIINDKLEHVYQLLRIKSEHLTKNNPQKFNIDLSILLKNEKKDKESANEMDTDHKIQGNPLKESEGETVNNAYMFLKPFDECSKTSMQVERILKKIGKPLNLIANEYEEKKEDNKSSDFRLKGFLEDSETLTSILHNKTFQKNNLFRSSEEHQYNEDRLLEELFYSDQNLNFGFDDSQARKAFLT